MVILIVTLAGHLVCAGVHGMGRKVFWDLIGGIGVGEGGVRKAI